ncbi:MAG TPA: hypothetical protein VMM78_00675, partial [Thermomicrobiales bacterium]|nr:hypothetical protein [Thermomicrobiales bacterium]
MRHTVDTGRALTFGELAQRTGVAPSALRIRPPPLPASDGEPRRRTPLLAGRSPSGGLAQRSGRRRMMSV